MNSRIHLFTFATDSFQRMGRVLGVVSIHRGFDSFYLFNSDDYQEDFKIKNLETLSLSRGGGYWLWKPYIILRAIEKYPQEDFLLYLDSGALPKSPAKQYKSLISDSRIHVWAENASQIKTWTDPEVLALFGENSEYGDEPMIWAGVIAAKNSQLLEKFAQYWLQLCEDPKKLHPETSTNFKKTPGFVWHRHDQSLLSLIVAENPEWFVVHSVKSQEPWARHFDRHRNFKVRYHFKLLSFPTLRGIRKSIVDKMPHALRSAIRGHRTSIQNRKLSDEEIESLKKAY